MYKHLQRIFSTLAFVCVATASFAQTPAGQIRGNVTDETGGDAARRHRRSAAAHRRHRPSRRSPTAPAPTRSTVWRPAATC